MKPWMWVLLGVGVGVVVLYTYQQRKAVAFAAAHKDQIATAVDAASSAQSLWQDVEKFISQTKGSN
jgi:hypothetical protein